MSRNKLNRSVIGIVPTIIFSIVAVLALWQFLPWIGYGLLALLAVAFACALYLMLLPIYHYSCILADKRRHSRLMSWLVANEHAAIYLRPNGDYWPISAEHQQAMLAPPEITVKEVPKVDEEQIITLHQKHVSLRSIAKQLGYSYYTVQKVCAEWDAKVNQIDREQRAKEKKSEPSDWREQV